MQTLVDYLHKVLVVDLTQLLLCDGHEVLEGDRLIPAVLVVAGHCGHLVVTHLTTGHLHEQGMQTLVVRRWRSVRLQELVHLTLGQFLQPFHDHLDVGDRVLQETGTGETGTGETGTGETGTGETGTGETGTGETGTGETGTGETGTGETGTGETGTGETGTGETGTGERYR